MKNAASDGAGTPGRSDGVRPVRSDSRSVRGAHGRYTARRLLPVLAAFLFACHTVPPMVEPWPCDRIEERPEVEREVLEMKRIEEAILWDGQVAIYAEPGESGLYLATREWMVEMDAKCAADRALVGEPESKIEEPSAWDRFREWLRPKSSEDDDLTS